MRKLGNSADQWNRYAGSLPDARSKIERELNRLVARDLIGQLDGTELRVLVFVIGRTLGWQKFAEAIPMSHFLKGIRDPDGLLEVGEDDQPYCRGVGICKEETVRSAVRRLASRGLLTIYWGRPGSSQPANVYMPFHEIYLARALIDAHVGVLPGCAPATRGEHVIAREAVWQITQIDVGANTAGCVRLGGRGSVQEYHDIPMPECTRISLEDWKASDHDMRLLADRVFARYAA